MKKVSLYQWSIIICSLVVIIMTLMQLMLNLNPFINHVFDVLDIFIWLFFLVDYIRRFSQSKNKKAFVFENKIDLLTIIPYFSALRLLRVIRITKVLPLFRFIRVIRITAMLSNLSKQLGCFFKTNNFHYVAGLTLIVIILGAGSLSLVEGISFQDALWWCIVTVTTVGYGDLVPKTGFGRVIASLVMISGIGFLGVFTGTISTYFLNRRLTVHQSKYVTELLNELTHFDELSEEEFNRIVSILKLIKTDQEKMNDSNHEKNID